MAKRKQLNIGLSSEQHAALIAAAEAEHITPTAFARRAILDALEPPEGPDFAGIPAWLLHVLLFFSRRPERGHSGK